MSKAAEYQEFFRAMRSSLGYWKTYSLMQFTSSIARIMKLENVHGKSLAGRLGISPTQVSKVLSGQENITVETMAKFADALDAVVHIHVAKRGVQVQWHEVPPVPDEEKTVSQHFTRIGNRTVVKFARRKIAQEGSSVLEIPPELKEAYG